MKNSNYKSYVPFSIFLRPPWYSGYFLMFSRHSGSVSRISSDPRSPCTTLGQRVGCRAGGSCRPHVPRSPLAPVCCSQTSQQVVSNLRPPRPHPPIGNSSADWTVRLWEERQMTPLHTLRSVDLWDVVNDVAWSPTCSTVFASVAGDGRVQLWDLAQSTLDPIVSTDAKGPDRST